MTILKVMVDDAQADELKKLLHDISFIKSVEEEQMPIYLKEEVTAVKNIALAPTDNYSNNNSDTKYIKIKKILDAAKGKGLFKDIEDPVEWQRQIRKEWERDF